MADGERKHIFNTFFSRRGKTDAQPISEEVATPLFTPFSESQLVALDLRDLGIYDVDKRFQQGGIYTDISKVVDYIRLRHNEDVNFSLGRTLVEVTYSKDFSLRDVLEGILVQLTGKQHELPQEHPQRKFWELINYDQIPFDLIVTIEEGFSGQAENEDWDLQQFDGNMRANIQEGISRVVVYSKKGEGPIELLRNLQPEFKRED